MAGGISAAICVVSAEFATVADRTNADEAKAMLDLIREAELHRDSLNFAILDNSVSNCETAARDIRCSCNAISRNALSMRMTAQAEAAATLAKAITDLAHKMRTERRAA